MCFGEEENVLVFSNQTIRSWNFQLLAVMLLSHKHRIDHFMSSNEVHMSKSGCL